MAKTPIAANWTANSTSPYADQSYPNGDRVPTGWAANEPAGMTSLEERTFASTSESGWWNVNATITADSSSTYGTSGNVGRLTYPASFAGGSAPGSSGIDLANSSIWNSASQEVYLCFEMRLSANWQDHPTGTNKVFFITMSLQGGGGDPAFNSVETNLTPSQMSARSQGTGGGSTPDQTFLSTVEFTKGVWHLVEMRLKANALGVSDGEYEMWVDGVLVQQDLSCQWMNTSGALWDTVKWEPTWGGIGGTVAEEMYMDMSRIYVGVK